MKTNTGDTAKKQKIVTAAMALFRRTHDVRRVSLEAIAGEASVSPTTIYNNFGNRETLVLDVVKELIRATIDRHRALVYSDLPFPQKLISIISGKMAIMDKMNQEIIEKMVSQDKNITPFIDEIFHKEIKPLWKRMMEDGIKQGYVDPSIDLDMLFIYLDILQAGFRAKPEILKGFTENMEAVKQLTRLMFYGFLKKEIDLFQKEGK